MPDILGNLGSHLLQSVTDKAGNIGNRFEEDFSGLAHNITGLARNITGDVDHVAGEIAALSVFMKIALALLSVLLFILILRYLAFGARALFCQQWCRRSEHSNLRISDTRKDEMTKC